MTTRKGKPGAGLKESLARLTTVWEKLGAPHAGALYSGLSSAVLHDALRPWSRTPPTDLVELYSWADGMRGDLELFPGGRFLSSREALEAYRIMVETAKKVTASTGVKPSVVWDKSWLPVFAGDGGYFLITSSSRREPTPAIWFNDREEPETTLRARSCRIHPGVGSIGLRYGTSIGTARW
jgi:hypothetical protein